MRPVALLLILGCGDPAPSKAPSGADSASTGDGGGEEGPAPTDSGGASEDSGPPPGDSDDCIDDNEQFSGEVVPLLESDCIACHSAEGAASGTRYVLQPFGGEEALAANLSVSLATVYNTLHQFTAAGLLREIAVDGARVYFDTNVSDHHHFLIEDSGELQDIHGATVALGNLPAPPDGLRVDRIDVVVRLRRGPA